METVPESADAVRQGLAAHDYLADVGLATSIFLALAMRRPLLLEGEAGVGKTEVAKVLAAWTGAELVRLQCYEGIDASQAVYEWDYARQLLHLRALEASGTEIDEDDLYSERFLVQRPLLRALAHDCEIAPVLLIDEVDRADDEFEAFLLELLSDWTISVPELGAVHADVPPVVVLTSNRTRDVHDALKRRCLYHWISHPDFERELAIIRLRAPQVPELLAREVAGAIEVLRGLELYKPPGVAESIDWAQSLATLGASRLDEQSVDATLGTILKYHEDHDRVRAHGLEDLVRLAATPRADVEDDRPVHDGPAPDRIAVAFARVLRGAGIDVPVGATIDFARALDWVGLSTAPGVYWAGRATLIRRPDHIATYDRAFDAFWGSGAGAGEQPEDELLTTVAFDVEMPAPDVGARTPRPSVSVRWSPVETLRDRDFASYSESEFAQARRLMADLRLAGARRPSRRRKSSARSHGSADLRRTVRRSLRAGGEVTPPVYRAPSTRPRPVVLLLDVSGSMEPYARAFVRFVHAAVVSRARVEAFALGTRLTRITRELSSRDPDAAVRAAAHRVVDWSGGTRLGDGLRAFNDAWGIRGMARGAIVVILSDGWDRGDPAAVAEQMARLARVAHKIVWVNPLKASPGYAPLAQGMAAALPHVDVFVEGHSFAALEEVASVISR